MHDAGASLGQHSSIRLERDGGVLTVTFHGDGGSPVFGPELALQACRAFQAIAADPGTQVVILASAGQDIFLRSPLDAVLGTDSGSASGRRTWHSLPGTPADQIGIGRGPARWLLEYVLAVEAPVIAAMHGRCEIHAEIPLMSDIVLATEGLQLSDAAHIAQGMVPGDGCHAYWQAALGLSRARYFHWMGTVIDAAEALRLGIVHEIVPQEELLPRARAIAEQLLRVPPLARRFTRLLLAQRMRRHLLDEYYLGYSLETLALTEGCGTAGPEPGTGSGERRDPPPRRRRPRPAAR